MPVHLPYNDFAMDLPPTPEGSAGAIYRYPSPEEWLQWGEDGAAQGASISAFGPAPGGAPPPEPERSAYMKMIWDRLDGEFRVIHVPSASDLDTKFAALLAADDLPDICRIMPVSRLENLLESRFADLTEYLSGDAIKAYPGLANLPTKAWRQGVFAGGIYGIPRPDNPAGQALTLRTDNARTDMRASDVVDGETLLQLCRELTNERESIWAATAPGNFVTLIEECLGGVNEWGVNGDSLVHSYTTEQRKEALSIVAGMWKEKLFHPDAYGTSGSGFRGVPEGKVSLNWASVTQWQALLRNNIELIPGFALEGILPPKWEGGGQANHFLGSGVTHLMGLRQADPDRIKMLLEVMNWFAAPRGTDISVAVSYGVNEEHFNWVDGAIITTPLYASELTVGLSSIASPPAMIYAPGLENDQVKQMYDYQADLVNSGIDNASEGLHSETAQNLGASLEPEIRDVQDSIIQGRADLSAWDDAVKRWRERGGDAMAEEYSLAHAAGQ